ncbi:VanZ family protein [Croceivirga thetidis]
MLLITYLSLYRIPEEQESNFWFDNLDKLVHLGIYLVTTVIGYFAFQESFKNKFSKAKAIRVVFVLAVAYGLLIELLQHLMPYNRMAELMDVIANTVGALLGCWLIQKYSSLIPSTN